MTKKPLNMRANDCDHSECIEREEQAAAAERERLAGLVRELMHPESQSYDRMTRDGAFRAVLALLEEQP